MAIADPIRPTEIAAVHDDRKPDTPAARHRPATPEQTSKTGSSQPEPAQSAGVRVARKPKAAAHSGTAPRTGEASAADDRPPIRARLTGRVRLPHAVLDPKLLPPQLFEPLQTAGLAGPDCLPGAAVTALAMLASVAGPGVGLAPPQGEAGKRHDRSIGFGLRVCLVAEGRDLPVVPTAVLGAAHAVQNMLLARHRAALDLAEAQERIAGERRSLHAQAVRAAAELGHEPPPPLQDSDRRGPGAPPRIVVEDGAGAAVTKAAEGGTGVLLVDERRMPSLPRTGHGDPQTAALLNAAALGHPIATRAAGTGHVVMRTLPLAVVGVLTVAECEGLPGAGPESLIGTAFVPAVPPPPGGDGGGLVELAMRLHAVASDRPVALVLDGGATSALARAAGRWSGDIDGDLQPLSAFVAQLPDLARRLAVVLHLIAAAAEGRLSVEIGSATLDRAVALVDALLLPLGRQLLSAVSTASAVEADALRLVAALRRHTSAEDPVIERREWQRATQTAMQTPARFKAAVRLLQKVALITAAPPPADRKGGEYYAAATSVHADI